jgi:excisionase family DNA binding protein
MSTTLITLGEAAEALRISTYRLVRLVRHGQVPHVRLPDGEVRFDDSDLAAWVESRKANVRANHSTPKQAAGVGE